MSQDASKIALGGTNSSDKTVDPYKGAVDAGKVVRLKSDGTISVAKADGEILGVSLGGDLSDAGYTSVCRRGLEVPVLLTDGFTPAIGAQVSINDTTGAANAAGAGNTAVNAIYKSGVLTGITALGAEVRVALIDMQGGL